MRPTAATSTPPPIVTAVVVFSLIAASISLILAIYFALSDKAAGDALMDATKEASETATRKPDTIHEQAAIDFAGLAKLAEAVDKVDRSGRFLICALAFAAVAAVAASAGAIAG